MKVRMIKTAANAEGVYAEGKEYDLDIALAEIWVARGAAEALESFPAPEPEPVEEMVAVNAVIEKAVGRRGRVKKN
jgi:hypothetical protein